MDDYYKPFHEQVRNLDFQFHDVVDLDHDHPSVNLIRNELRQLKGDLESGKNPRTVEARMHTIQEQIVRAQHEDQHLMSAEHTDHFKRTFEDMRMNMKHLPHY